jgi:hypothetical protein
MNHPNILMRSVFDSWKEKAFAYFDAITEHGIALGNAEIDAMQRGVSSPETSRTTRSRKTCARQWPRHRRRLTT